LKKNLKLLSKFLLIVSAVSADYKLNTLFCIFKSKNPIKMKGLYLILCVVVVITVTVSMSSAGGMPNVGESLDPETSELLERYLKARRISPFGYMGGLPWSAVQQKRNSELINSILGLPKVMNDAGRRK